MTPQTTKASAGVAEAFGNRLDAKGGAASESYSSTTSPSIQTGEKIIPFEAQTTWQYKRDDSERAVLALMLTAREAWRLAKDAKLQPGHFQDPQYRTIAKAIFDLGERGIVPDRSIVVQELERQGKKDEGYIVDDIHAHAPSFNLYYLTSHVQNIINGQWELALENLVKQAAALVKKGNAQGATLLLQQRTAEIASTYEAVGSKPAKIWTLAELYDTEFEPTFWAIPDLVSAGLNVLAGHPKIGKSFLSLQWAHAATTGGKVFGIDVQKMRVLFIALEDNEGRLKERALAQKIPPEATLDFVFDWPLLAQGGTDRIIRAFDDYDLVIGDTLGRMLGVQDRMDYAVMTAAVAPIQKAARQANKAMLFLDHHGKLTTLASSGFADPVQDILGSTGLAGVVDTAVGLYKQRGKDQKLLASAGRDTKGLNLVLEFDSSTLAWQSLGDAKDVAQSDLRCEIVDAIAALVDEETVPTADEIARMTNRQRPNIVRELNKMVPEGRIMKGAKVGKKQPYYIPGGAAVPFYDNE